MADQPKGRDATRSPDQDMSSLQADVPLGVARHRDIMPIDHRRLVTAGKRLAHGTTGLAGPVADQAGLHGVVTRTRDLGLALLSVQGIGSGSEHP